MSQDPGTRTRQYSFLLLENFTLLAFSCAVEPLRLANLNSGAALYRWRVLAEAEGGATSSGGLRVSSDGGLEDLPRDSTLIVVGGRDVRRHVTRDVIAWLRREARKGITLGSVCTGAYALAAAGLLDGRRSTIHWDNRDSFAEDFPDVQLSPNIYVIDGNRISSSGGTTASDLMLRLIAQDHGTDLAAAVADQMIHTAIRGERDEQRLSIQSRIGVRHPRLTGVIRKMESNIEEPISPATLAAEVGMSTRQLERLFRRYLNCSPKRYYMELRLERARHLLVQTDMSVINVALASGFASPSHFSKCYRAHFGTTPYRERSVKSVES